MLVGLTLHDEQRGNLRSGESLSDAICELKKLNLEGLLANCSLPERITDAMPMIAGSGFTYSGGYANAFAMFPRIGCSMGIKIPMGSWKSERI